MSQCWDADPDCRPPFTDLVTFIGEQLADTVRQVRHTTAAKHVIIVYWPVFVYMC